MDINRNRDQINTAMRKLFLAILLLCCYAASHGQSRGEFYLGGVFGMEPSGRPRGEVFARFPLTARKLPSEFKVGLGVRSFTADFDGIKDFSIISGSLFGDYACFPFRHPIFQNVFMGIRAELLNINTLSSSAKKQFDQHYIYKAPPTFAGMTALLQLGYRLPLSEKTAARFFIQYGGQMFTIANGEQLNSTHYTDKDYFQPVLNFNVSVEIRLATWLHKTYEEQESVSQP